MRFYQVASGTVLGVQELRALFPEKIIPDNPDFDALTDMGCVQVTYGPTPQGLDRYYIAKQSAPVLTAHGIAEVAYEVVDVREIYTPAELAAYEAANPHPMQIEQNQCKARLAETDRQFQPRWFEDLVTGTQHATYQSWVSERESLRSRIAELQVALDAMAAT